MNFIPTFRVGNTVSNDDIVSEFKCGIMGGMRRSNKTNTIVIVSDKTKKLHKAEWKGNVLHFTGMKKTGDQKLEFMQNKTLAESNSNGVEIHLFEVFEANKYVYKGVAKLCDKPYFDTQLGADDKPRRAVVFPLCLVNQSKTVEEHIGFCKRMYRYCRRFFKRLFSRKSY